MSLSLGIDFGTSACRVEVIDESQQLLHLSRADIPEPTHHDLYCEQSPDVWWHACQRALLDALSHVDKSKIKHIAVDGTSSTLLICDKNGVTIGPALMYRDQRAQSQAQQLKSYAPSNTAVHSASSSLAKILWFKDEGLLKKGLLVRHQADWITGRLRGSYDIADENNALKMGYDTVNRCWPQWLAKSNLPKMSLPKIVPAGHYLSNINPQIAQQFDLPTNCQIMAGTTDSTASFIASGANQLGDAVSVLGSSLVIKILSDKPVFDASMGVYSHRLGQHWLVGGASNCGAAVLKQFFTIEQIKALSLEIDPSKPTQLSYMPLPTKGERFPVNNSDLQPNFEPRPTKDAHFLQAIFESMAKIEQQGYSALVGLGAPSLISIRSCGGGAQNKAWRTIRQQILNGIFLEPKHEEAAVGAALLAASQQNK